LQEKIAEETKNFEKSRKNSPFQYCCIVFLLTTPIISLKISFRLPATGRMTIPTIAEPRKRPDPVASCKTPHTPASPIGRLARPRCCAALLSAMVSSDL